MSQPNIGDTLARQFPSYGERVQFQRAYTHEARDRLESLEGRPAREWVLVSVRLDGTRIVLMKGC